LRWQNVILDLTDVKNIRSASNRGKAITGLNRANCIATIDEDYEDRDRLRVTSDTTIASPTIYKLHAKRKHQHSTSTSITSPQAASEKKYTSIATPNDTHKHRVSYKENNYSYMDEEDDDLQVKEPPKLSKGKRQLQQVDDGRVRDLLPLLKASYCTPLADILYHYHP
jgi:hypothetical protein